MYLFFSKSKASFSRINFSQQLSNCDVSDGWDTQVSLRGNTTTTLLWKEERGQWDAIIPDLGKRFQPSIRSYFQTFPMLLLGGIGNNLKIRSLTSLQIQNRRKNMLFFKKQNNKTKRGQDHAHPDIFLSQIHFSKHCGSFGVVATHTPLLRIQTEVAEVGQQSPSRWRKTSLQVSLTREHMDPNKAAPNLL